MRISLSMSQLDAAQLARRIRTALESPDTDAGARAAAELRALAAELLHAVGPFPPLIDNPHLN